jgi:hypothetical protein
MAWMPAASVFFHDPDGHHIPGIDEVKKRLAYLDAHGPTQFTFQVISQPDEEFQRAIDWSSFQPCLVS